MSYADMWQQFTHHASRVVLFAQEEAKKLGASAVDTDHMLLGILRESNTSASWVLERYGVTKDRVRAELQREAGDKAGQASSGVRLSVSPEARQALEYAVEQARDITEKMGKTFEINTEHILLVLLHDDPSTDSKAVQMLRALNVDLNSMRKSVIGALFGTNDQEIAQQEIARQEAARLEAARQETIRQEAARQEVAQVEAAQQEIAQAQVAVQERPVQDTTPPPVYEKAFELGIRIYEASKIFPPEEAGALTEILRRKTRTICTLIVISNRVPERKAVGSYSMSEIEREILRMQVLLDFVAGYGYLAKEEVDEIKEGYTQVLAQFG